jgi:hypothetical protein
MVDHPLPDYSVYIYIYTIIGQGGDHVSPECYFVSREHSFVSPECSFVSPDFVSTEFYLVYPECSFISIRCFRRTHSQLFKY